MRAVSLASGSAGNAYCVESDGAVLLVDCGISCRDLVSRCRAARIDPRTIAGAVFTHNHIDHVKGLATFHRRFPDAGLFANWMTAEAIASVTGVPEEDFSIFENGQEFEVGPFSVKPFHVPHDVPDPVGYLVRAGGETYFHATDVGAPLDSIGVNLSEADYATLESNHDPVMLAQSARPECLKARIRGDHGHLANCDAADLVRRFASPRLKALALAHLSRECNAPHVAERTMRETLVAMGRTDVELKVLGQDEVVVVREQLQKGET